MKNKPGITMTRFGTLAFSLMVLTSCQKSGHDADHKKLAFQGAAVSAALLSDHSDGKDWPSYGRTHGEQHFSPLTQINSGNVASLRLAWSIDLPPGNSVSQPLEVDGTVFFTTGSSIVHAVDAISGREIWVHDPHANEVAGDRMRSSWGSRGIGYWNGKIYTGTVDGRLIALDANTGSQVWSVQTLAEGSRAYITGAPRLFDGKVIIGQGGADVSNLRGYVTTYDAETGKQLWRFYTVPGNPAFGFEDNAQKKAAATWFGEWWKYGGGGNVWNAITYDAKSDTIFLGTGNGSPWNRRIRSQDKGDNLFLCSIVALDAKTGQYKWHYQVNPGESWDYNASMDMHLMDLKIKGVPREVLITAPKNGFLYVIDRRTGKLISAERYVKTTWAERIDLTSGRPVENPAARYPNGTTAQIWPGPGGAHTNLPSAVSPQTGLFYVSAMNAGAAYSDAGVSPRGWKRKPHNLFEPAASVSLNPTATSALVAIDPVTQKLKWSVSTSGGWNGGVMATGGNLVFQGQADGTFNAYDARMGRKLWTFAAQAGVLAPPITYLVKDRQYVTVLTGTGLSAAIDARGLAGTHDYRTQARRVLTFAIGGKATISQSKPFVAKAPSDSGYEPDPAAAHRGAATYVRCMLCHGLHAVAAGSAPDLRTSTIPQTVEAMDMVVRQGALISQGMPKFGELSDRDMADLRAYLRSRSAELRAGENTRR